MTITFLDRGDTLGIHFLLLVWSIVVIVFPDSQLVSLRVAGQATIIDAWGIRELLQIHLVEKLLYSEDMDD